MHIVLLCAEGRSPTEIARVLCIYLEPPSMRSPFASSGRVKRPSLSAKGEVPMRRLESQPASTSSVWSKRTRPPNMAGCAPAGAASFWPWSCSRSESPWLAGRRFVAFSIASAFAGEGRALCPPRKTQRRLPRAKAGEAVGCPFDAQASGTIFPGPEQATNQPQSRILLDAQRDPTAAEDARNRPKGVDFRGTQLQDGRPPLALRRTQERRALFIALLDGLRRT